MNWGPVMGVKQLEEARGTTDHTIRSAGEQRTAGSAVLDLLWSDWRLGVLAAVALAAGWD
jgi:hypothetical protein